MPHPFIDGLNATRVSDHKHYSDTLMGDMCPSTSSRESEKDRTADCYRGCTSAAVLSFCAVLLKRCKEMVYLAHKMCITEGVSPRASAVSRQAQTQW